MAVIKQGILGGFQNKIGNVVGTSWKGIAVMKSLPVSVANPRTAGQVEQRSKFKQVSIFAGTLLAVIIKPLWDRFSQKMSGYNMFIQRNISLFNASGLNTPADLVISSGKMSGTPIISAVGSQGSNGVVMNWQDDSGQGFKQSSDIPFIVVFNNSTNEVSAFEIRGTREQAAADVYPDFKITLGDELYCYLAFKRTDGTIVSDTSVASTIVVA